MNPKARTPIDPQEYEQKRYEIAKDILASTYAGVKAEDLIEAKQRESLIFNCIQIGDMLLKELGYFAQEENAEMSIHNLSTILKNAKKDE
jgi:HEPN domain-containing protein